MKPSLFSEQWTNEMTRTTIRIFLATGFFLIHHDATAMLHDASASHDLDKTRKYFENFVNDHDGMAVDRKTARSVVREIEHP
jgi:hypothetical protein